MKLKRKVVMLPTNNEADLGSIYKRSSFDEVDSIDIYDRVGKLFINKNPLVNKSTHDFKAQHLYIISDEPINKDDWYYIPSKRSIELCVYKKLIISDGVDDIVQYKIIATTDESLGLPSPSPEFVQAYIKAYNVGNPITEVMVDYEEYAVGNYGMSNGEPDTDIRLKVDKTNCITITKVKDSWTREELDVILEEFAVKCIKYAMHGGLPSDAKTFTKSWIEQNL